MRQFFYGDDNMAEIKNFLIRTSSLLLAAVFLMTAGMFTLPLSETDAAVMRNQGGIYLNEALSRTSVNGFLESRQQWQMTLDNYSVTDYYLGTPFSDWAYGASPYGDKWQCNECYGNIMTPLGGNSVAIEWDHEIDNLDKCESDVSPYEEILKKESKQDER